jgi:cytoskeleton protein RodZ
MAADPHPGGFGRKLREARESRGISLRQIANATKISVAALEALERDHISRLPGGIFSRAFVRSYAIEVGLDPEQTIQEFIAQFPNETVTAGHTTSQQAEDNEALESHRRMASAFVRLILVSLPIVGLVVYYTARGGSNTEPTPEPQGTSQSEPSSSPELEASAALTPAAQDGPLMPAAPEPADVKPAPNLLRVGVLATGPCWVSAVVDGQTAIQRELAPGERQMLEVHRELVLTAGDGAALTLTLNGEDARPLGKPGEVVTTRFSLANFKEYLVSR